MVNITNKVVEKFKIHILHSVIFFSENRAVYDNIEKCGRAREAADGNIAARCMLY
jgi:hypothetical protein